MRKRVGIIFGGRSAEHEVSIVSASNIARALDPRKFTTVPIYITKSGTWQLGAPAQVVLENAHIQLQSSAQQKSEKSIQNLSFPQLSDLNSLDVIFPVLHGPFGEDGTMQGFLKLTGKPFVGNGVLGSAIGMDKDVTKRLLLQAGIPIVNYVAVQKSDKVSYREMTKQLGKILFIKPANLGSSIGVKKVRSPEEFSKAVTEAFVYDTKIMIEQAIDAREIECSILGNDTLTASVPGEIVSHHEFYSYESKYLDEKGAELVIPAKLTKKQTEQIQQLAIKTFRTLCFSGMARIDFSLDKNTGKIFVNEANTIPGFTNISMYPKLWEKSGISYAQLIEKLISLAIKKFNEEQKLKTSL